MNARYWSARRYHVQASAPQQTASLEVKRRFAHTVEIDERFTFAVLRRNKLEHLRADGCTAAPSYLFSRPATARNVRRLLARQQLGYA